MTEVIIVKNEREAGDIYGRSVADLIKTKPNAVLGLATGSSPLAAYQSLARIVHSEHIDVSQVRGFALDEYLGLPLDHPQSYHSTIHRTVVEPLGLNSDLVHVPGDVLDGAPLSDGERIAAAWALSDCRPCLRQGDRRSRWHRRADSGHRHRRACRFQRAGIVARFRHACQNAS